MSIIDNLKRACIYFIYDKDGIVDRYIIEQIKDIRKSVSFVHCVVNGKLTEQGKKDLEPLCEQIYVRENKGNDIGAYKAAIKYMGWDKINQFDELVLMNNTCFGPVYPFKEAFDWAESKGLDFWGLTIDEKSDWMKGKRYIHYNKCGFHFQSYFLVFRKPLLGSALLENFFDEIPENATYLESGCYYEYAFPGYFEEHGYKGGVYCNDITDLDYPLLHNPVKLLSKYRMPLFKKRSFTHHYTDVLNHSAGEATAKLIDFIENNTDYNIDLVWESILRTASLSDIVRCCHLNRVLPSNVQISNNTNKSKVGLIYHMYYEDMFDENISYILNFDENTDILITTDTQEKKQILYDKLAGYKICAEVCVITNRGRDVSALLVAAKDFVFKYDLICFAHDKKSTQIKPQGVGRSWSYKINQNLFGSKKYVNNIIDLFNKESRLGIAFPPYPNHSFYANSIGTGWVSNFINTQKILNKFDVNVKINEHTLCVAPLGTCFWFRPDALKKLFKGFNGSGWDYKDFPREPNRYDQTILHAIERAYAYFAQDAGYYPVFLYNSDYSKIEFTNLEFNKTGSTEMRAWVEILAMNAIGNNNAEKSPEQLTQEEAILYHDRNINYGIKQSLIHVAFAIRCKYPKFWSLMLPIRRLGQTILRIKTK